MTSTASEAITYDVVALAELEDARYKILADRVKERLAEFTCDRSSHLQKFARESVHRYEKHGHSRTYVLITAIENDIDIAGFFTVGMTALDLGKASKSARNKLMGDVTLGQTGAFSIAELARSDSYSSAQLPGSALLDEAKRVIRQARAHVGGRFLVVDAREEVFTALYAPAEFKKVSVAASPIGMEDTDFVTACCVIKDW